MKAKLGRAIESGDVVIKYQSRYFRYPILIIRKNDDSSAIVFENQEIYTRTFVDKGYYTVV